MSETKTVCILPFFPEGSVGGVARHIAGLRRHLSAFGWRVVDRPNEADIVHTHAVERSPIVDVYTNHGMHPLGPNMPAWQRQQNAAIFDALKWARQVIAVSEWTARQWAGLTGVKPHVIPNGIDPNEWSPQVIQHQERARYDLHIGEKTPVVLWGKAGLSDVCDPTPAIELALRRPDIVVAMTVDPKLLSQAPLNVRLLGRLPFERMQGLIAICDVYLATTLENHSVQVLEAMACGKPILGYRWGGTAETVTDGEQGRLVEPGDLDALEAALTEVLAARGRYGERAREHALSNYALPALVKRTAEVYDLALAEKRRESDPETPVCSIVIPLYNKDGFVREAIESALAQRNAPRYEVIVVDDGSTDGSRATAEAAIAMAAVPARMITQENQGVAAARNNGILAARGQYICCLDADDVLDQNFLARLSAALDADPGLGIAYSDMVSFGWDHARGGRWMTPLTMPEYEFEQLKKGNFIPCCNLFRRKAWQRAGGYRDINPSWEDYELWLRMGKLGWHGQRVPGGMFHYRKVPGQGRDHESQGQAWKLRATVNRLHRDIYPPMVSVVIPCYKQSRFLAEAIESALDQSYADLEVIVVDDGNEAGEAAAIRAIVKKYRDAHLVINERNMGLAAARNAGVEAAQGTWIVPLDADDKLSPSFLERTLKGIDFNSKMFGYTDSYLWWPDDPKTPGRVEMLEAHEYDFDALLVRVTWPCTILYAKDAWRAAGGYKAEMSTAGGWEDWEFVVSLGEIGVCGQRIAEPLFYYRQHSASQMRHSALQNKPRLQETMRRLHAPLYRGERPMSCCGKGKQATTPPVSVQATQATQTATAGNGVLVRYVGYSAGRRTWRTPGGGTYAFSTFDNLQAMPAADAAYFEQLPEFQVVR